MMGKNLPTDEPENMEARAGVEPTYTDLQSGKRAEQTECSPVESSAPDAGSAQFAPSWASSSPPAGTLGEGNRTPFVGVSGDAPEGAIPMEMASERLPDGSSLSPASPPRIGWLRRFWIWLKDDKEETWEEWEFWQW